MVLVIVCLSALLLSRYSERPGVNVIVVLSLKSRPGYYFWANALIALRAETSQPAKWRKVYVTIQIGFRKSCLFTPVYSKNIPVHSFLLLVFFFFWSACLCSFDAGGSAVPRCVPCTGMRGKECQAFLCVFGFESECLASSWETGALCWAPSGGCQAALIRDVLTIVIGVFSYTNSQQFSHQRSGNESGSAPPFPPRRRVSCRRRAPCFAADVPLSWA